VLIQNHRTTVQITNWRGSVEAAFWFVMISMLLFGEETHPRIS